MAHATIDFMVGRRIVVAGPGTDNGGQQAQILARSLRDAGDEVIFTGPDQGVERIVLIAIAEDAVAIGLPGESAHLRADLDQMLARHDAEDIEVLDEGAPG